MRRPGRGIFLLLPLPGLSFIHHPFHRLEFPLFLYFRVCVCVRKWAQGRVQTTAAFDQCNMWEMEHFRNADS